ncbi:MAG TPA: hypothetical protein VN944_09320 [Nitrospiria bacterium]|nr:hypothetical protein [Nitrospiria bacterium]
MTGKKKIFLGMRVSKEEIDLIESLRKELRLNKSEMIRYLVQQAMTEKNSHLTYLREEVQELREILQTVVELNRFIASLLAGLTQKSSKSDPAEAEKLIQMAKQEAARDRKIKSTPENPKENKQPNQGDQ